MHYFIIQIESSPISEINLLNEQILFEDYKIVNNLGFIDYVYDFFSEDEQNEKRQTAKAILKDIFNEDMTLKDIKPFIEEWRNNTLNLLSDTEGKDTPYKAKYMLEHTHLDTDLLIYYKGLICTIGDFIDTIYKFYEQGHQFYMGNSVGYHF